MKIISVTAQKGGVGKSSVALNLAGQAELQKEWKVAIVDTDTKQRSLTKWAQFREKEQPLICAFDPEQDSLSEFIEGAKNDGFDLLIFDTPPHHTSLISEVARTATFSVVVCEPAIFDIFAIEDTVTMLSNLNARFKVLFNSSPAKRNGLEDADVRDCRRYLEAENAPLFRETIAARKPVKHAQTAFMLINEYEPRGQAAKEISAVWKELEKEL
ncbi:AAA family ATPase [Vibrio breoganii]